MFHTLLNVQEGEAISLLQYIDNHSSNVRVGLRAITYTVGWYNVNAGESFRCRNCGEAGGGQETVIPPMLYGLTS